MLKKSVSDVLTSKASSTYPRGYACGAFFGSALLNELFEHPQNNNFFEGTAEMARPDNQFTHAVLVTGASGGIGRAICLAFATAGWFVGIHYHRNKVSAEETLAQVVITGGTGALYEADVRETHAVQLMIEAACRRVPAPSVLICNAGIGGSHLLLRQHEEDWAEVVATNLTGTFHCLRAMAPSLLAHGGGSIVVIGSTRGFHGSSGQAAYAASKAGLIGLVHTAAQQWGAGNVRVNLLLPGWQISCRPHNRSHAGRR